MSGKNVWFNYDFKEDVFLTEITVSTVDYGSYHSFEFEWEVAGGQTFRQVVSKGEDEVFSLPIREMVKAVRFKPPTAFLRSPKIGSVTLSGFPRSNMDALLGVLEQLNVYRDQVQANCDKAIENAEASNLKITEAEDKLDALQEEVDTRQSEVVALQGDIGRLTEERNSLNGNLKSLGDTVRAGKSEFRAVEDKIAEREEERKLLSQSIVAGKSELQGLRENINMFPTEISAFVEQGADNIRSYWKMAVVPIATIVLISGLLVFNAANLTTVLDEVENARIWSILVTRMPYVIVSSAIIAASLKLSLIFVGEIMRINQQRLNLSKISIIANDVSKASETDLVFSEEERHTLRTQLKMELLRDHLKDYITRDFNYTGARALREAAKQEDEAEGTNNLEDLEEELH
ncbi:hypothetical protein EBB79_19040 [Parasedimentitalea marina]|uniref:Uncharacterized protein n=2 Tax=Parasedimentitalea marina TaxID=2483033 RepID=A0A3T0N727_9RHOB|nr:hypothetical protein EBB79_19040 [Parasedimentitalea marina]